MDQTQKKFKKCEFFKRTLQFVISVSVFYFSVWYSSGFSILPQSFNAYFSTCLFSSMLTRALQRKYMFIIFNGIIAFLAKSLTSSPPISAFDRDFQASNLSETKELVSHEEVEQVEKQEEHYEQVSEVEVEEEENEEASIAEEEEEEDEEGGTAGRGVMVTQDDDELAETTMALANTDELNRKFEEFIRKMKEEIRIEAQRHPIAV